MVESTAPVGAMLLYGVSLPSARNGLPDLGEEFNQERRKERQLRAATSQ
jgi:hypothetical protein